MMALFRPRSTSRSAAAVFYTLALRQCVSLSAPAAVPIMARTEYQERTRNVNGSKPSCHDYCVVYTSYIACLLCRTFEVDAEQSLTTGQLLGHCLESVV